jgi:hypothetical protein
MSKPRDYLAVASIGKDLYAIGTSDGVCGCACLCVRECVLTCVSVFVFGV